MGPTNEVSENGIDIDLSEFETSPKANAGTLCPVGMIIEKIGEEKRKKLIYALAAEHPNYMNRWRISSKKIRNTLIEWGYRTGEETISVHRRKVCGCPPTSY